MTAQDVVKLVQYIKIKTHKQMIVPPELAFIYKYIENYYESNPQYFNTLVKNNAIVTFGFQIIDFQKDILTNSVGASPYYFNYQQMTQSPTSFIQQLIKYASANPTKSHRANPQAFPNQYSQDYLSTQMYRDPQDVSNYKIDHQNNSFVTNWFNRSFNSLDEINSSALNYFPSDELGGLIEPLIKAINNYNKTHDHKKIHYVFEPYSANAYQLNRDHESLQDYKHNLLFRVFHNVSNINNTKTQNPPTANNSNKKRDLGDVVQIFFPIGLDNSLLRHDWVNEMDSQINNALNNGSLLQNIPSSATIKPA